MKMRYATHQDEELYPRFMPRWVRRWLIYRSVKELAMAAVAQSRSKGFGAFLARVEVMRTWQAIHTIPALDWTVADQAVYDVLHPYMVEPVPVGDQVMTRERAWQDWETKATVVVRKKEAPDGSPLH